MLLQGDVSLMNLLHFLHSGLAHGDVVSGKSLRAQMLASFIIPPGPDLVVQPLKGTKFCYDTDGCTGKYMWTAKGADYTCVPIPLCHVSCSLLCVGAAYRLNVETSLPLTIADASRRRSSFLRWTTWPHYISKRFTRPHTRTPSCAHVLDHEASKHDAEWSFTQRQVCLCNCLCPVGCCRPIHLRRHQTQTARRRMKTPATGAKLMRSVSSTTQTRWW